MCVIDKKNFLSKQMSYSISTDFITPKTGDKVNMESAKLTSPVITGGTLTGINVYASTIATSAITGGTISSAAIGTSTITGAAISGGTVTGVSITQTTASTIYTVTGLKVGTPTIAAYENFSSPIATISFNAISGTGAGTTLTLTTIANTAMRPAMEQTLPIYITIGGTGAWGRITITTGGVITLYATATGSGVFTDTAAITIASSTFSWDTVPYV